MDRECLTRLRLDRRLILRRGWIGEQELAGELEKLPDVSDKIRPPEPAAPPAAESAPGGDAGSSSS